LKGGRIREIISVLQIPPLARNIIFVINLDDTDVKIVFAKDICNMVQGGLVFMKGVEIATLYKLIGSIVIDGCNSSLVPEGGVENLVVSGENTILWHEILGHIGEKGIEILHGNGMVEGMYNFTLDFNFYEHFIYGKQNRVSFPSTANNEKGIIEIVHSDVFEPMSVP